MTATPSAPPHRWRKRAVQAAVVVGLLGLLAWRARPDGRLHVVFLETKGDAALIQTPAGGYVLIDGGADPTALTTALGRRLPFWRRTLDAVMLTSRDGMHLPGQIAALARYRAGLALAPPGVGKEDALLVEWLRLLDEARTPIRAARAGQRLDIGGATIRVLAAGDGDEAGVVLRLDYGATSVLFDHTGGEADERALLRAGALRPATIVAFPWQRDPHTAILGALRPHALVLTDGRQVDPPAEQTFRERAIRGARLLHERLDGTIEWISDGQQSWIVTER
jgi:beta-lactamase superfamily II metal-dependent hydrolase